MTEPHSLAAHYERVANESVDRLAAEKKRVVARLTRIRQDDPKLLKVQELLKNIDTAGAEMRAAADVANAAYQKYLVHLKEWGEYWDNPRWDE